MSDNGAKVRWMKRYLEGSGAAQVAPRDGAHARAPRVTSRGGSVPHAKCSCSDFTSSSPCCKRRIARLAASAAAMVV